MADCKVSKTVKYVLYLSEEEPTVLYGKETLVPKDFIREMMNGGRVHSAYTTYTRRGY